MSDVYALLVTTGVLNLIIENQILLGGELWQLSLYIKQLMEKYIF